jgi:WD40 repeat protein
MSDSEVRRTIEAPAEIAGLRLETGLVDVMVRDLAHEPGSLPLLSHALLETWRRRSGRTLTLHGYNESGGVQGAIAKTAETVWTDALTEQRRPVARRIFLRLTELGEGTEDTRRRVAHAEMVSGADAAATDEVLELLVDRRLITIDDTTVQVAHEALIREWPRLRGWLDEDREGLRAHRHLTHAAEDWAALGHASSELYRGPRLSAAREWLARDDAAQLNELEAAFVNASEEREQADRAVQQRSTRRLRTLLVATALLLIVAVAGGLVAMGNAHVAHRRATVADSRGLAARARSLAFGHFDLALLLAVEARRLDDSVATRGALEAVLSDGARLERFVPLDANTSSVVSRDGRMLAIGHGNGTVEVRDLTSDRVVTDFADGGSAIGALAFSADSRTIAVSHQDGTVDLRDVATGTARAGPLSGGAGGYSYFSLSPDGRRLAAAGADRDVVVWDLTSPVGSATFLGRSNDIVGGLVWSSDNRTLAVLDPTAGVTVYDAATGKSVRRIPVAGSSTEGLALGPDGRRLAVGTGDGRFSLFDLTTGKAGPAFGEFGPPMEWFAFSPDGATLAADNAVGVVTEWDLATRRERGQPLVGVGADAYGGVLGADGRLVTLGPRTAAVWRTGRVGPALGRIVADFPSGDADVTLSRDGSLAWMGAVAADHWVLYDMRREQVRAVYPQTDSIGFPAWSPDATAVAVSLVDGRVRVVSAQTGATLGVFAGLHGPAGFPAFSPDGHLLAAGGSDGTVLVWDLATDRPFGVPFQHGGDPIQEVAFSPDGKTFAVTSFDGSVNIYDVATHRALHTYHVHQGVFVGVRFSPDGRTLAAASPEGTFLIDAASGRPLGAPLAGHSAPVIGVAFSRDGRTLATTSLDGTVILYDVATRQPIGIPLDAGDGGARTVAFTPDGQTLASSYQQGQVVLWDIDPNSWQQRACSTAGRNLTRDEWHQYLGARAYQKTCPQWPAG